MLKKIFYSLLLIYTLVGFFLLPIILKPQITKAANEALNATLSVESVYINPFIFKVELSGVELKDLKSNHLVSFKSLEVDIELYSLFNSALHIKSIILKKPKISLIYNHDKSLNLSTILKASEEPKEDKKEENSSELPRIIIDKISIKKGALAYKDLSQAKEFDFKLNNLSFKLQDIDTNDFNSSGGFLRFHTLLGDSGVLDIRTKITGLKPLKVEGNIDFKVTKLYKELEYVEERLGVEVANGAVFMHANYAMNIDDLNNTLVDNISLKLEHFRIKPKKQHHDVLNINSLHVEGVSVKPFTQEVSIEKISLDALHVKATRDNKGAIDWIGWLPQSKVAEDKNTSKNEKEVKPWNVLVKKIVLSKISAEFDDATVSPLVKTKLNEFNFEINNFMLDAQKPFTYNMNLVLNDKFKCNSYGDVKHDVLNINSYLKCENFDIVHYRPYIEQITNKELKVFDISLNSANVSFDLNASAKEEDGVINALISNANLTLKNLVIDKKSTKENLIQLKSFKLKNASIDTKAKELSLSKVSINSFKLNSKKDKKGNMNLDNLVEVKVSNTKNIKARKITKKTKPFHIKLNHFNINKTEINFIDESISIATKSTIDNITLNAYNIDSNKNSWLKYDMLMRINKGGTITSKGKVRHSPLKQVGDFKINKLSLKEITPYLQESLFLNLNDGYLSVNSKVKYEKNSKKPDLYVDGGVTLESFELSDSRNNDTLLTFAKTELNNFDLKLFPSSIYIDEVNLDAFYVDAQIDKNKQMNFSKLTKQKADVNETKIEDVNTTVSNEQDKFLFKLMKLHVSNGAANFADYSLPIDFKTSMHNLNGDVYSISNSSGEISYINIDGEVNKYGSTKIKGSLDTANIKSFTDISVNFRNLALNSYSGYSAQFAGYKIDKGKLFLDLEYKILNSQLLGKNSLIIKQIELGDEVEDENITTLPLGFAIALLEDSDGVIDINMPVEGDLDNPDFKYGTLILKTFVNLIVKAVASPFKFLGDAMGFDGDALKFANFEAAKVIILAPEREKLDNIAKMLIKKPKLSFAIVAAYDKKKDTYGLQVIKLTKDVLSRSDNKENATMTVDILEDIYEETLGSEKLDKLKDDLEKKYPKDEVFKVAYQKELLDRTIKSKILEPNELENLAISRANALKNYLVENKNIDANRVVIEEPKYIASEEESFVQLPLKIIVK